MGRHSLKNLTRETRLVEDLNYMLHVAICDDVENCLVELEVEEE